MDITIFFIRNNQKHNQPSQIIYNNKTYKNAIDSIANEIKQYNLSGEIVEIEINNLPNKVNSNIVLFIDNETYIEDDYLNKIIALNNFLRYGGLFCGPTHTKYAENINTSVTKINDRYKKYNLNFGSSIVSDITDETHNYPEIIGCAISGRAYNDISYVPTISPRHTTISNKLFIAKLSKLYRVYYSVSLQKIRYINLEELDIKEISNFYYDLGYQDGSLISYKNTEDKRNELWHRFVETPEILDNEMPRWLLDSNTENDGEYLENLVICKCKYQIGFYEGMMSRKLI